MKEAIKNALQSEKLQSRKWWAFIGVSLISVGLLISGKISPEVWGNTATVFFGIYVTGNVIEKRQ